MDKTFRMNYVRMLQEELNSENFNYLDEILKESVLDFIANDKKLISLLKKALRTYTFRQELSKIEDSFMLEWKSRWN